MMRESHESFIESSFTCLRFLSCIIHKRPSSDQLLHLPPTTFNCLIELHLHTTSHKIASCAALASTCSVSTALSTEKVARPFFQSGSSRLMLLKAKAAKSKRPEALDRQEKATHHHSLHIQAFCFCGKKSFPTSNDSITETGDEVANRMPINGHRAADQQYM